ncbi:HIT domain-containing protein [Candidatus Saccharibacteria bacterium]|nr:HIT domain-containing protein [Candidatus Saccharibacteria bacterium]NCU40890.1 HIT domain-containing protein [Candidatus Saccharibacteria bacterium]
MICSLNLCMLESIYENLFRAKPREVKDVLPCSLPKCYTVRMQEPSIFTHIINGNIPSYRVYEDDLTYAFLDISPTVRGHVLVIPKQQVPYIWDLDDETYHALMQTVKILGAHMREKLRVDYVGVKVVGEQVPHAHVHLVPFNHIEEYKSSTHLSYTPEEFTDIAQEIALE